MALEKAYKMSESLKRSRGTILISFLWVVQSIGRIYFAASGTPSGMGQFLDVPISSTISFVLFITFLFLGILGLVAAFGLLAKREWGVWATLLASIATIIFDVWGLTIQLTAAIGLIVPLISLICLYFRK